MSIYLRIVLIVGSVITCAFVFRKIRKSQMRIEDSIFWLIFCLAILVLSIFPGIAVGMSELMNMESPVNFIFLAFIFIILLKLFLMSIKISQLEDKIGNLTQRLAIEEYERHKSEKTDMEKVSETEGVEQKIED